MSQSVNRPVWVDLSSHDPAGSRAFYRALLGWVVEPSPDPQFGGYAVATLDGKDVAGIGGVQSPGQPTAWSVYLGTTDAAATAARVTAAGGTVVAPPFPVGPMGSMAVFRDPTGAFISAWQAGVMSGFTAEGPGSFGWAELNTRDLERSVAFYTTAFGWGTRRNDMPIGPYVEFLDGEDSVGGCMGMMPTVPPEVPDYWTVYFRTADIDASVATATDLGAQLLVPPTPFPAAGSRS
ncbi:MAG: VOC family protein [Chloroflexota bacterium]